MELTGWQVSDNIVDYFYGLEKAYKKDAPRQFASMLNDMAFTFREAAPRTIASRYTIRSPRFVTSSFYVMKRADPSADLLDMSAIVTSNKLARGNSKFSGWTEELGGENTRSAYYTLKARGGSAQNPVSKKYVTRNQDNNFYPIVDATPLASLPLNRRTPAFIKSAQSERRSSYKAGRDGMYRRARTKGAALRQSQYLMTSTPLFFMTGRGGGEPAGSKLLYRFKDDDVFSGKIEAVKIYKKPANIRLWSWDAETVDRVMLYFPDNYIVEKYINPIILGET